MKKLIIEIVLFIYSFNISEAQEIAKNVIGNLVDSFNSFVGEVVYQRWMYYI